MRVQRSKWLRLWLVCLAIAGSMLLGFATVALFDGGSPTVEAGLPIPSIDELFMPLTETTSEPVVLATTTEEPSLTASETSITATLEAAPTERVGSTPTTPTVFLAETFDEPSTTFPSRATETWSVTRVNQRYQFKLTGQPLIGTSLALPDGNYRLSIDIAVVEGGAGIVFLLDDPAESYRILLTTGGAYTIEHVENNVVTKIVDWTTAPALEPPSGATNQLQIERRGKNIVFYVNDQRLTDFSVPAGDFDRTFGLVLTSRKGQGEATFDNLRGELLP